MNQPRQTRLAQWGLLAVVAIMPLHAFLSIWAGHLFGHQAIWQAWKELVLLVCALIAAIYASRSNETQVELKKPLFMAIGAFTAISLLVTVIAMPQLKPAVIGIKTDLEFLAAFVIAYIISTKMFAGSLIKTALISSAIAIGFGLLQIYVLPNDFLSRFGYGSSTVQPFLTLDPALKSVRILSTLGGPNQLGSYLVIPICLVFAMMLRRFTWWQPVYLIAALIVMWHCYSRSAWLGLAVGIAITFLLCLPQKYRLMAAGGGVILAAVASAFIFSSTGLNNNLQYYVFHSSVRESGYQSSTDLHGLALKNGIETIKKHPLGEGLGTSGPASFYGRSPNIPESYYLQLGIEAGVIGLALFLMIMGLLGRQLGRVKQSWTAPGLVGALVGVSVVNLFLHGWADSSTALTYWALAGAVLGAKS